MGGDPLVTRVAGQIIGEDTANLFNRVLQGDFVGRDSSGSPTAGQNLGTASIPWGVGRLTSLILNGLPVEPGLITAAPNRIISGAVRPTSQFPDYLRPAGTAGGASLTVKGLTTPLSFDVNGIGVQFVTDEVKGSLTVAPSINNTCLINDAGLVGDLESSKYLGENDTVIPVDAMGSNITAEIGKFVALRSAVTQEFFICKVQSATELIQAGRGFFFDSNGDPISAGFLNNNELLVLESLGYIFIDQDGVTIDVIYNDPVISGKQPSSPATGDYWLDTAVNVWKRFSGVTFVQINRTFAGYVTLDTVDAIGTRPEYFSKSYSDENTLIVDLENVDTLSSHKADFLISINGELVLFDFSFYKWIAATDFESGVSRTVSTTYWLYISELGKPFISDIKPFDVRGFLKGWYHPHESWRAVAQIFNNASNEFELINSTDKTLISLTGQVFKTGRIILSNNVTLPLTDIDFSGNLFTFDNGSGQSIAPNFTKQMNGNFAPGNNQGMLDTGVIAIEETYFTFVIKNKITGAVDYLASLSFTSPTLPTNFTEKEYIGALLTDGSANIQGFVQIGKYFYSDVVLASPTLNTSTTTQTVLLNTPIGIETIALISVTLLITSNSTLTKYVRYFSFAVSDVAITQSNATIWNERNIPNGSRTAGANVLEVLTNSSGQIRVRASANNGTSEDIAATIGWIDNNLQGA